MRLFRVGTCAEGLDWRSLESALAPADWIGGQVRNLNGIRNDKQNMSETDCLFCRMIAGEIPADFIHQDDRAVVIRDINPQAPTHLLVIPREHLDSLDDASQKDEALLGHLLARWRASGE